MTVHATTTYSPRFDYNIRIPRLGFGNRHLDLGNWITVSKGFRLNDISVWLRALRYRESKTTHE